MEATYENRFHLGDWFAIGCFLNKYWDIKSSQELGQVTIAKIHLKQQSILTSVQALVTYKTKL